MPFRARHSALKPYPPSFYPRPSPRRRTITTERSKVPLTTWKQTHGTRWCARNCRAAQRNKELPAWELEKLDLRDHEIGKLPPELGLLPLDVFLVCGNMWVPDYNVICDEVWFWHGMHNSFRVPQKRVWEREGSWLRGRIEQFSTLLVQSMIIHQK